jgi:hypothetical protein
LGKISLMIAFKCRGARASSSNAMDPRPLDNRNTIVITGSSMARSTPKILSGPPNANSSTPPSGTFVTAGDRLDHWPEPQHHYQDPQKKFFQLIADTIAPSIEGPILELDELWSYVAQKTQKVWIWLALERQTRKIAGLAFRDRPKRRGTPSGTRCPADYRERAVCATDQGESYSLVLPSKRHGVCANRPVKPRTLHASTIPCPSAALISSARSYHLAGMANCIKPGFACSSTTTTSLYQSDLYRYHLVTAARTRWFLEYAHRANTSNPRRYRPWYRQKRTLNQLDIA